MFYLNFISEILALATGLFLFKKIAPVALRLLVLILIFTVINEGFAYFKVYNKAGINKSYFYNVFFVVELISFFLIYYLTYQSRKYKRFIVAIFIFSTTVALYFLLTKGAGGFNPFFLNAVCFCLLVFGFAYFYFIYNSPEVNNISRDPLFWFSTGIIVANFIHLLFVNATFIESFKNNPGSKQVFQTINTVGNLFYYGCIITSFICSSRYRRQVGT
jgi:hypothetical protein